MEPAEASAKPDHVDGRNWENFPAGLRVLVVDDDPLCLKIIEQMLKRCNYEVFVCATAAKALEQLREKSHDFDLVLSDVYMPDMDGFKLLEAIGLELDLPVIMMSCNGEHSTVMRGVTHGACDFLIKPVRIEELRNIWQHVIRRSKHQQHKDTESEEVGADMDAESSRKRKELSRDGSLNAAHEAARGDDDAGANKKPRVVWSVEMHQQFVAAVNKLGIDKAVPKKILELMGVDGLTRENVASHLQKYRLYLKRVQTVDSSQPSNHLGGHQQQAAPKPGGKSLQQQQQLQQQPSLDMQQLQQQSSLDMQQQVNHTGLGQQQQPQQQHMPSVMPGMPPGNGSLGMMGPFGPGSMPGMGMNAMNAMAGMNPMASMMAGLSQMGLPGMPGIPPMSGMGPLGPQAAAGAGTMGQMPPLPGMGMPGMAGLPGMPGLPPIPGMPGMGHMPGVPGMPGHLQGSGMNMQNDPAGLMSMMANMQALFQAQQQQAAAAAPANSGGASSGVPAQAAAAPSLPSMPGADPAAAAAAAAAYMTGMNPAAMMAGPGAIRPSAAAAGINGSGGGSNTVVPAPAGTRRSSAGQNAAAKADQADFSSVFDDVFDPTPSAAMPAATAAQQQQLGVAASRPIAAGDAAVGGMDDFFDYFLKG